MAIRRRRTTAQGERADGATTVPLLAYDDRLVPATGSKRERS
ncbi:hypothetical protein [Leptospira noguchii]|nr:hypothetical protein [Leptospira noguchii]